ncbi:MAG: UDP-N-acetylmuramate:L-alanyl-gamma-D-glutamyl-meso-diaminopimelate ligase [Zetaproteobacteria bacterium CG12_big_fil_rev_8_21_14_0_65_54_13]|nr:MAG: UDP-N-acetylmuramate:L-alanyl-gamma-D-glutamyl-meso-diaminopimelate ligase [Zetaproteobacteria bacterium CG12_big_fil_rev_8_21_14_0_65_54_13]PIX55453.1 MAG: UDP-N-acetylmuramate:L-alanyl-gamma-D-glutamyl-meso-diaminopimelate ligase [Zetaproteobacteria bacterium CG_4_10_14_3_um_filter_54_28]PJA29229.1 MAG: UDP-N-acetylmuramate:L-alanyl-gamma-D-glutamyl-meso-diaminopimelate ligase [Zetaproteobacteria bacterium CG_4_9_14_3_um_filter_54_145]
MNKHLHILGVCGTAMAAIAALAKEQGWRVTGSDAGVYPPMSDYLAGLGIEIAAFDAASLQPAPDLCVIGNAMSRGNVEVEAILDAGLPYCSGPAFIGDYILPGRHAVVVAGTHGKTTTSSLLAWVLDQAGLNPGFMIGGIPEGFSTGARLGDGAAVVLEGDEYDTAFFDKRSKFLHYHARTLILNNLEYDHADIFPDLAAIQTQFHHLIRTVPASGRIVLNVDDDHLVDVLHRGCWTPHTRFARYGGRDADWHWQPLSEDGTHFCLYRSGERVMEVTWGMIGIHQVANACAVAAAASGLGVAIADIASAFTSFAGIRRRMTLVGEVQGKRVFDDFAHHPTAIRGVVTAARAAMKGTGRLWVIVEPRSNTMRTRIHQQALPGCFAAADQVIFVPPSDRNLQPAEVLDAAAVCSDIGAHARVLADAEGVIDYLCSHALGGDDILILSNGGFDDIHRRLLDALTPIT